MRPEKHEAVFRYLITPDVSANSVVMTAPLLVMAGLRRGHPDASVAKLDSRVKPGRHSGGQNSPNVFKASSASGNIGVIKFR